VKAPSGASGHAEPLGPDARILEIATAALRDHGPRRTTIVDIAAASGMSHANVYRYFPSKVALFEAVTTAWLRPIEAQIRVIAEGPDPAPDKLERLLITLHRAYRDKLERDPALFAIFVDHVRANSGLVRRHRLRLQQDVLAVIGEGLAQASFAGEARAAMILSFDLCHRFISPVSVALDSDVPRGVIEPRAARAVRLLLRGLAMGRV
jgi:AcrR family transcriptional regulator